MPTQIALHPHQRVRLFASAVTVGGVDLIHSSIGTHVSYRVGSAISVRSTLSAGRQWYLGSVANNAATDAIPTLAVDHQDNLFCAFEDEDGDTEVYKSGDYGHTWDLWTSHANLTFPRMLFVTGDGPNEGRQYLAGWRDPDLVVYASKDWLESFVTDETPDEDPILTVASMAEQLVDLTLSRRGGRQLVYQDGGNVRQRYTKDGRTWDAATTLVASRTKPAVAHSGPNGVALFWDSSTLYSQPTAADYQTLSGAAAAVTAGLSSQYVGLGFDRAENAWLAGQVSGSTLKVCVSPWGRGSWQEV